MRWSSSWGPNFRGSCRRRSESRQTRGKVSVLCPERVIPVALAENLRVAACTGVKFENFPLLHRYRCAAIATSFCYILFSQRNISMDLAPVRAGLVPQWLRSRWSVGICWNVYGLDSVRRQECTRLRHTLREIFYVLAHLRCWSGLGRDPANPNLVLPAVRGFLRRRRPRRKEGGLAGTLAKGEFCSTPLAFWHFLRHLFADFRPQALGSCTSLTFVAAAREGCTYAQPTCHPPLIHT